MIALLLAACGAPEVTLAPVGPADLDVVAAAPSRPYRRMNLDQLSASIVRVSGRTWTEVGPDGEAVALFDQLSGSLGKPDYLSSTHEELAPGLLYQKFLDDAAKSVCAGWMADERVATRAERRLLAHAEPTDTLATAPDAVEQDLSGALLRFHGRVVPPGDPALGPWRRLFERGAALGGDPMDGWRLVCVGLFTHPDFYAW